MHTNVAFTTRSLLLRLAAAAGLVLLGAALARAGGPKEVAGSSYFAPSTMGQPLTWANGQVNYYTDQGNLSPLLSNSAANDLVTNAFYQWTSISTVALAANQLGQLAEDVNGSNVILNSDGTITIPTDIQPSAANRPVGIVFDYDGAVTNALLGAGAGDSSQCFWNAAYGGVDNFNPQANFTHALVVVNGQCAQQSSQLTDVEYRLVRVLGGVLGLGWSQANLNVITNNPAPRSDDFAGFPVMHFTDPGSCIPITACYPNPYQPAPDDMAALSRIYPITAQNQSNYFEKQIFSTTTARIHGSVYFANSSGGAGQPMQGVNVVARWIDPSTGQASRHYVVTSISGFLFTGNAGNPITGYNNAQGVAYSQFGSNDQALEGFFDLAGLQIPNGAGTAQYQLSVEAVDPAWSAEAGPYGISPYPPNQVAPSGSFAPVLVTVTLGGDLARDIIMPGSAEPVPQWAASETWTSPAAIPPGGDWMGSLSGYGNTSYFLLPAQINRTFSVAITSLNQTGTGTMSKAAPVIGVWAFGEPPGTQPGAFTTSPFNSFAGVGTTRLDVQVLNTASLVIGIADWRGDGRPDYTYHAHVLYGDSVIPSRVSASGGAVLLQGTGFAPALTVAAGSIPLPVMATSSGQMLVAFPAQGDGPQTITITDPVSDASSTMTGALTVGAAASDKIVLLQGSNPATQVGTQAINPMIVRVVAADGITPVSGATIGWSTSNSATLAACGGASACSVLTDEGGLASTGVTPGAAGVATITATLAPGVYSPAQSVSGPLVGLSSSAGIGVLTPYLWVAEGASVSVPLTARVVNNGAPKSGATVNFAVAQGSGALSAGSAVTNGSGYATVTLTLTEFIGSLQVTACVAPGNAPCQTVYGNAVALTSLNLQAVSGSYQVIQGQGFQPLIVRVVDSSTPANPVLGASVLFQAVVLRPIPDDPIVMPGDPIITDPGMPVILSLTQNSLPSDANGLVSVIPSVGSFTGPLEIELLVSAGTSALLKCEMETFPEAAGASSGGNNPAVTGGLRHPVRSPMRAPSSRGSVLNNFEANE